MSTETFEAALAAAGSKTAYTGASMSGLGWFLSNEFFGLAGVGIGVIGIYINWHYKHKADLRDRKEYEVRMRQLGERP